MVAANSSYNNIQEFLEAAKTKGLRYASAGTGGSSQLYAELLWGLAGVKLTNVPYPGAPEMVLALMQNNAQAVLLPMPVAKPSIEAKQLRPVVATSKIPSMPDVPAASDVGIQGYTPQYWIGIFAPAKTPSPIVERLNKEINTLLQDPGFKARNEALGYVIAPKTVSEFTEMVGSESKLAEEAVKAAKLTKQ
jgi:tripartite-type tricarboxylate transporter receptor subunit TctC